MKKEKYRMGYSISAGYKKLTIYHFNVLSGHLFGISTITPLITLSRKEKYTVLAKTITKHFGRCAVYIPTKKEISESRPNKSASTAHNNPRVSRLSAHRNLPVAKPIG